MNNANIKKFYELLKADKTLAEELQNEMNAVVLQFAAKQGLAFTAEDLAEYEAGPQKLADEELTQVNAAGAGGAGNPAHVGVGCMNYCDYVSRNE